MATPAQQCARITAALGDLAGQEEASLGQDDLAAVLAIQDRAAPLVAFLAETLPNLSGAEAERVRADLGEVHARRTRTSDRLDDKIAALRAAMQETIAARGRAARVGPVYGGRRTGKTAGQLLAQG